MTKAYKDEKPEFGHAMLKFYSMDPEYINLNNGSYGTAPKPVLRAAEELTARIESNPDLFFRTAYIPLLKDVRQKIATLIEAKIEEVALVPNASVGLNTVLRNFEWEEGDIIFAFTTTYTSISTTIQYLGDVPPHPTTSVINLNFPMTHAEIVDLFRKHVQENPAKPNKKRVAIIDSIASNPGVLLPWKEMVKICKKEGVWSVIDAAHSIGQEVGLNLTEAAPDFWISVIVTNGYLPNALVPFYMYRNGNGIIECTPYLTVIAALEFREWMGGEEKINAYCHDLAIKGGQILAKVLGTRVMDPDGELTLNMVNVELPIPNSIQPTEEILTRIKEKLLFEHKAYSVPLYHNDKWWTRCSAQVWNELEDFEKIGKMWLQICDEVIKDFGCTESSTLRSDAYACLIHVGDN